MKEGSLKCIFLIRCLIDAINPVEWISVITYLLQKEIIWSLITFVVALFSTATKASIYFFTYKLHSAKNRKNSNDDEEKKRRSTQKFCDKKRVLNWVNASQNIILGFLNAYVLIKTHGLNRICLPDSKFEQRKWNVTNFEQTVDNPFVMSFIERMLNALPTQNCFCNTWEAGLDFCLPRSESKEDLGCSVADCYSNPSWVSITVPFVLMIKTFLFVSKSMMENTNSPSLSFGNKMFKVIHGMWVLFSSFILLQFGEYLFFSLKNENVHKAVFLLAIIPLTRLISPWYIAKACSCSYGLLSTVYMTWFVWTNAVNSAFFAYSLIALRQRQTSGCLMDASTNQITFLVQHAPKKILYYEASHSKWDQSIHAKYDKQFRVLKIDLQDTDQEKLCNDGFCQLYNTRFERDALIWVFMYIGYIGMLDFIFNLLRSVTVMQEFKHLLTTQKNKDERTDEEIAELLELQGGPMKVIEPHRSDQMEDIDVDKSNSFLKETEVSQQETDVSQQEIKETGATDNPDKCYKLVTVEAQDIFGEIQRRKEQQL